MKALIPIYKSGDIDEPTNFRTINLLLNLSKMFYVISAKWTEYQLWFGVHRRNWRTWNKERQNIAGMYINRRDVLHEERQNSAGTYINRWDVLHEDVRRAQGCSAWRRQKSAGMFCMKTSEQPRDVYKSQGCSAWRRQKSAGMFCMKNVWTA